MDSVFHLRDGLYFARDGDEVVLRYPADLDGFTEVRVPVNEWASAIASTSKRGENEQTFREALEYLEA